MRLLAQLTTRSTYGDPDHDGRRVKRTKVQLQSHLRRREGRTATVVVLDLSTLGFRAETIGVFGTGTQLWLKLPGLEALLATVAWTDGIQIGCEFAQPLHPAVVERIVAMASAGCGGAFHPRYPRYPQGQGP